MRVQQRRPAQRIFWVVPVGGASEWRVEGGVPRVSSPRVVQSALRYSTAPHLWGCAAGLVRYYGYGGGVSCVFGLPIAELLVCPLTCLGQSGDVPLRSPQFPSSCGGRCTALSLSRPFPVSRIFFFFSFILFWLFCSHPKRKKKKLRGASPPAENPYWTQQFHNTGRTAPDRNTTHGAQMKNNRKKHNRETQARD